MEFRHIIKKARKVKGFTQKEVASSLKMNASQYSRIENGKTNPSFTVVFNIAKTLGIGLSELFKIDNTFSKARSANKALLRKIKIIEQLNEQERNSIYNIIDELFNNIIDSVLHQDKT